MRLHRLAAVIFLLLLLPGCGGRSISHRLVVSSMGVAGGNDGLTAVLEIIRGEENERITAEGRDLNAIFTDAERQTGKQLYLGAMQSIIFSGVADADELRALLMQLLRDGRISPNTQVALCENALSILGETVTGDDITALLTRQYTATRQNGLKELVNLLDGAGRDGLLAWLAAEDGSLRATGVVATGQRNYRDPWQPDKLCLMLLRRAPEMRLTVPVAAGEATILLRRMAVAGVHFTAKGAVVTITAEATVRTVNGGPVSRKILEQSLEDALRRQLLALGADIRFGARLEGLTVQDDALTAVTVRQGEQLYTLPARQVVLALGHSARDTFEMLYDAGVAMEQKPFAMGVRIEHRQSAVDAARYRKLAGHPSLPPATYKLSCHLPNGRSAFSFCVCPGGQVVAAASEARRVVTNGMSEYARDRENINGALLVNVTPADFPDKHPLSCIWLQRQLEDAAFALGGGDYRAPCQRVEDFLAGRPSTGPGNVQPSYLPAVTYTDLHRCLPPFISETLALALPELGRKLRGYDDPDALLTGVETRSSSPVRLVRDEHYEANIRGVYPCGEGAGYAGGILSAAADGMRCAEKILEVYR